MDVVAADFTVPDTIVGLVCAVLAVRGAMKGFAWQAVRTAGMIGALWGATSWYAPVADWLDRTFAFVPTVAAPLIGWLLILIGIMLVFAYLAYLARGAIRSANLTAPDRILGLVLGAIMGLVFCAVGFVVYGHLIVGEDDLRDTLRGSVSARYMAHAIEVVEPLFPDEVRERFGKALTALDEAGD
jgi:uncharacterized membrane protein required for colicin V production